MKTIQKYQADDGYEFDNESACAEYEKMSRRVDAVMSSGHNREAGLLDLKNTYGDSEPLRRAWRQLK